jgi:hypothetical protein
MHTENTEKDLSAFSVCAFFRGWHVQPPRPYGLRSAGPLALLLAPYMQPGMAGPPDPVLVARAWPAGLGACSKM